MLCGIAGDMAEPKGPGGPGMLGWGLWASPFPTLAPRPGTENEGQDNVWSGSNAALSHTQTHPYDNVDLVDLPPLPPDLTYEFINFDGYGQPEDLAYLPNLSLGSAYIYADTRISSSQHVVPQSTQLLSDPFQFAGSQAYYYYVPNNTMPGGAGAGAGAGEQGPESGLTPTGGFSPFLWDWLNQDSQPNLPTDVSGHLDLAADHPPPVFDSLNTHGE
jgi:hypothetical protein